MRIRPFNSCMRNDDPHSCFDAIRTLAIIRCAVHEVLRLNDHEQTSECLHPPTNILAPDYGEQFLNTNSFAFQNDIMQTAAG